MFPAISANLPVYLLPPRGSGEGRTTAEPSPFGPAARLDISGPDSDSAQKADPGSGLYGPDGQFIEAAARRETEGQTTTDGQPEADRAEDRDDRPSRDLSLSNADVALPPAAREELVALVDRIQSHEGSRHFDAKDYKQIARLMEKVGRFDAAVRARDKADELQHRGQEAAPESPDGVAPKAESPATTPEELVH